MKKFTKKIGCIFQLEIPFDTVYTSVFLVEIDDGYMLIDTGSSKEDVREYVYPALQAFRLEDNQLKFIVLSHCHGDHSGGLKELKILYPNAKIITDVVPFVKGVEIYPMKGHTDDSIGVLDLRSNTLISCDGIQGFGVDKFKATAQNVPAYLATLNSILNDGRIENVLFSHAYEPWKKDYAFGRDKVKFCIEQSLKCFNKGD